MLGEAAWVHERAKSGYACSATQARLDLVLQLFYLESSMDAFLNKESNNHYASLSMVCLAIRESIWLIISTTPLHLHDWLNGFGMLVNQSPILYDAGT